MTGIVRLEPHARGGIRSEGFLRRRTALIVPLVLVVFALFLIVGIITMEIPAAVAFPGPQVFPGIVAAGCLVVAALFTIDVIRRPEPADVAPRSETSLDVARGGVELDDEERAVLSEIEAEGAPAPHDEPVRVRSNHRALLSVVAVLVVFTAALTPVGWLLSGAFLFWGVAWSLGSRRPVFDIVVAIAISSIVQLAFSAGLGLNLPPGILAGVF
ncbi:tripartite tricarboxylate transporter TctB family protein [Microbacterium sp. Marseille-Q6965]|uniref:tripartite tricarboxylate transporter TctB family protein n=1 Tax=Microbacterium sp. Marseille-Q6965 TaxID=2965072 RepID=UPI0021B7C277|nr:tripartite tricarboxylate transporter TctB family protein [Microbacterium sp. Marseille-Q6965]